MSSRFAHSLIEAEGKYVVDSQAAAMQTHWLSFDYLPVGLFGSVMGLTALSIAWRLAHQRYGTPLSIANIIGAVAMIAFVVISSCYLVKFANSRDAVRAEFNHPIAGNLFGTIPVSLLLLPIILAPVAPLLARLMWATGAAGMIVLAWMIMNRWLGDRQQIVHATPAWIIPVVGLLDMPLALPALNLQQLHGVAVFGFAAGTFFAIPLFTMVFTRLVFEAPIPDALLPSLMILLAPFAVGFSTYTGITGSVDLFAQSLYVLTLFLFSVLVGKLWHLRTCCPFRISWWAVSFPMAAASIAALKFTIVYPNRFNDAIAVIFLALSSFIIAGLAAKTLSGIIRGEMRALSS